MEVYANITSVAALIGDPTRTAILIALADGRALPAGELAKLAKVSPQTANAHLTKLLEGGLITVGLGADIATIDLPARTWRGRLRLLLLLLHRHRFAHFGNRIS